MESLYQAYETTLQNSTIKTWKNSHLFLVDQNGDHKGQAYSIYKCLVWDCSIGERSYHFCEGVWYEVNRDFVSSLCDNLDGKFTDCTLPENHFQVEGLYNSSVADNDCSFVCLDKTNISLPGETQIEPCDLLRLTVDGMAELIHVKIGVCSSVLSHLFFQGVNSANLLFRENVSREKLIELIEEKSSDRNFDECKLAVRERKIMVTLAIITKKTSTLKSRALPLFSRISLKAVIERVESMGVSIQVMLIKDTVHSH